MNAAWKYVAEVDRALSAACALFPGSDGALPDGAPVAPRTVPESAGGLVRAEEAAALDYQARDSRATAATAELRAVVQEAVAVARQCSVAAADIRQRAATDTGAIARGHEPTPEAVGLLVSRLDERLAEMQDHVAESRSMYVAAAERITDVQRAYTEIV
ncbi:hypothetical protein [Mycolicibacterium tusciae]|uniref:hypothetical protein n=1 Tax=Mycolicibacterium tusciae TaxID=75922 RepID=UPI000486307C|nr:hypothetical protein [Mycolicibacterium tusciae]